MEVGGQLHAPAALSPEKEPRYLIARRLDGPQSRSQIDDTLGRRDEVGKNWTGFPFL